MVLAHRPTSQTSFWLSPRFRPRALITLPWRLCGWRSALPACSAVQIL